MVGWAAVDNAIFALVQISLFVLARNKMVLKAPDMEMEPLLRAALEQYSCLLLSYELLGRS
jgi:hypothetical protein